MSLEYLLLILLIPFLYLKFFYVRYYTILRVIDGDTIAIGNKNAKKVPRSRKYRGEIKIRLIGVNAPESHKSFKDVEPMGKEVKKWAVEKFTGKRVRIEYDDEKKDRFDRHLCYVYIGKHMINEILAKKGMAFVETVGKNNKYELKLLKAQKHAKLNKKGIWKIYESPTKIRKKYKHLDTFNKF